MNYIFATPAAPASAHTHLHACRMRKRNSNWNIFDTLPDEMVLEIVTASMGPSGAMLGRGLARTCHRLSAIALPLLRQSALSLELVVPGITDADGKRRHVRRIIAALSVYPMPAYFEYRCRAYDASAVRRLTIYLGRLNTADEYEFVCVNASNSIWTSGICIRNWKSANYIDHNYHEMLSGIISTLQECMYWLRANENEEYCGGWSNISGIAPKSGECGRKWCKTYANIARPIALTAAVPRSPATAKRRRRRQRRQRAHAGALDAIPDEILTEICKHALDNTTFGGIGLTLTCRRTNAIVTPILRASATQIRKQLTDVFYSHHILRLFALLSRYSMPAYVEFCATCDDNRECNHSITVYIGYMGTDGVKLDRIRYVKVHGDRCEMTINDSGDYWITRLHKGVVVNSELTIMATMTIVDVVRCEMLRKNSCIGNFFRQWSNRDGFRQIAKGIHRHWNLEWGTCGFEYGEFGELSEMD